MMIQSHEIKTLSSHLKITKEQTKIHKDSRKLEEIIFYPPHEERADTAEYKKVHKELIEVQNLPCVICGVTNEILNDPQKQNDIAFNPYHAKQLETHHCLIEWALINAIDLDKFNKIILPFLKNLHQNNLKYQKENFAQEEMANWIDHNPDNLWVLCDVHHRAKYFGIHEITYPIWRAMGLLKDDFKKYITDAINSNIH